jgi:hypothetical protein
VAFGALCRQMGGAADNHEEQYCRNHMYIRRRAEWRRTPLAGALLRVLRHGCNPLAAVGYGSLESSRNAWHAGNPQHLHASTRTVAEGSADLRNARS